MKLIPTQPPKEKAWEAVQARLKRSGWDARRYGGLYIAYHPNRAQRIESETVAGLLRRAREVGTP